MKKESFAMEMFRDKDKKRDFKIMILFFIMWLITFLALAFMVYKYIELNNDIGVIETTTTQEIQQENENGDNNYIGRDGDINYGKTNSEN
nr:hypothetical protein [bacterium]